MRTQARVRRACSLEGRAQASGHTLGNRGPDEESKAGNGAATMTGDLDVQGDRLRWGRECALPGASRCQIWG